MILTVELWDAWSEPLRKWWVTHGAEPLGTLLVVLDRFAQARYLAGSPCFTHPTVKTQCLKAVWVAGE